VTALLDNEILVRQIAWTLLHTLWQGVVAALLLAVVLRAIRGASSNARYLVACAAMLSIVAGAIATFALLHAQTPIAAAPRGAGASELTGNAVSIASHATPPIAVTSPQQKLDPSRSIVTAWMSGVLVLAIWHAGGWVVLLRLRRGEPVERFADVVGRLSQRIGVTRAVRVIEAARVDVPAVVGVLRPIVLVPIALLNDLAPQQVEAILAHELAHLRRHDYLVNLIQSAVETVLFYHPATWWISRTIRRERENCCDDIAARVCGDDRAYAGALAALEARRAPGSLHLAPAATGNGGGGGDLLDRVRRVLKLPPLRRPMSRSRSLAAAAVALACVLLPLLVTAAEKPAASTSQPAASYRFVKVIVTKDGLRRDDKPIDVAGLSKLLGAMSETERHQTVLEVAAASPDVTVERFFTATAALHRLAAEHKLAYLSEVGIVAAATPATTRAANAAGIYYITGRIKRGGVYALQTPITLKQAIIAAGGPNADKPEELLVSIVRRDGDVERYALTNAPLADVINGKVEVAPQAEDVIRITDKPIDVKAEAAARAAILPADPAAPNVGEYYIEGLVVRTGVYAITGIKVTLKQALAAAGGLEGGHGDAYLTVIRRGAGDRESAPVANVRFSDLLAGTKSDAYLQANDVVRATEKPMEFKPAAAAAADAIIPADPDAKPTGEYFIGGDVRRVGVYSLTARKVTLKQAMAAAGGLDEGKRDAYITVIRRPREAGGRARAPVVNVRYTKLLSGAQRDAYLQAGDVVRVSDKLSDDAQPPARAGAAAPEPLAAEPPADTAPKGSRLEELILQRRNLALQFEKTNAGLGDAHPRVKEAAALLARMDQLIADERAAIAGMSPEQIAAHDAAMREELRAKAEADLHLERLLRTVGPKNPAYRAALRDIESHQRRIDAHAKAWRESAATSAPATTQP